MKPGELVRYKQSMIRSHHTDHLKRIAHDRVPMLIIEQSSKSAMVLCDGRKFVILHEALTQLGMR